MDRQRRNSYYSDKGYQRNDKANADLDLKLYINWCYKILEFFDNVAETPYTTKTKCHTQQKLSALNFHIH